MAQRVSSLNANGPLIQIQEITKVYQMGEVEVHALRGVTLDIQAGEMVTIMGPSGSGKSTLMNVIGCLDQPTSGTYVLEGQNVDQMKDNELADIRNLRIGFVFQTFNVIPTLSALENVALPLTFQGVQRAKRKEKARELLELVGLGDRLDHKPVELSGGEQQRVAIARALVNDPAILLADEPTGNLDSETGKSIMELLKELNEDVGMTVVIVTHNPKDAAFADRLVHIVDGRIAEEEFEGGG